MNLDSIFPYRLLPAMLDGVITVGSIEKTEMTRYSNYGRCVNTFAPGGSRVHPLLTTRSMNSEIDYEDVWIRSLPTEFMRMYGTSLSTGIVTGLISDCILGGKQ